MKDEVLIDKRLLVGESALRVQQIEVTKEASCPQLVFLHDALGSVAQWKDFPSKLALRCQLNAVVYDRAGHGGSSSRLFSRNEAYLHREALEILPELLQQLQIKRPILIGHSDGGSIALIYAAYHQPAAILTEAAHAFVEKRTLEGIRGAQSRRESLTPKLESYHGDKVEALFDAWAETWLDEGFQNWSLKELLPRITCPALIIQGREDQYGSEEQVKCIARGIGPGAEAFWVEQCGHSPHRQAEQAVLEKMETFIAKTMRTE